MSVILNLETATTNCSVSLSQVGKLLAFKEHNAPNYSHSEQLHVFIEDVLKDAGVGLPDLDAIAVSKGPGSYTGLRIGVSAAKGLCFSLDVPLVSISTLQSMAHQVNPSKSEYLESDLSKVNPIESNAAKLNNEQPNNLASANYTADYFVPVLDARRMEVYSAVFDGAFNQVRETRAEIIDENSFSEFAEKGKVLLVGSGAEKCKKLLQHPNFTFDTTVVPSAKEMASLSHKKFVVGDFENVAYFEPFYLKDFIMQKKK